jgi:hypothetical protein
MIPVPLFDLKFLGRACRRWCRNFKSAALERGRLRSGFNQLNKGSFSSHEAFKLVVVPALRNVSTAEKLLPTAAISPDLLEETA